MSKKNDIAIALRVINKMKGPLGAARRQLKSFATGAADMIKTGFKIAAAAAVASILAIGAAAIVTGADFEQAMANVGAVSSSTQAEMNALTSTARDLGKSTAFSATEAAGAMYSLSSAGLDAGQVIEATEPIMKLAGATMTDMGMAAELTMSTMNQFGMQASDSTKIVNVLAASSKVSAINMQRLSDALPYVGQNASAAGLSLETTAAALAALHNNGLMASQAGTGLSTAIDKLLVPNAKLRDVLGDVTLEGDGLVAVIKKLEDAQLSATDVAEMFGPRSKKAILALINTGVDGFTKLESKITGTNSAFEMYDRQMDTTQSKFKMFKSAMQETFLNVFDTIKPIIDKLITSATRFITENQDEIRNFLLSIVDFAIDAGGWFAKAWVTAEHGWQKFWESVVNGSNALGKALGIVFGEIENLFRGYDEMWDAEGGPQKAYENIKKTKASVERLLGVYQGQMDELKGSLDGLRAARTALGDSQAEGDISASEYLERSTAIDKEIASLTNALIAARELRDEQLGMLPDLNRWLAELEPVVAKLNIKSDIDESTEALKASYHAMLNLKGAGSGLGADERQTIFDKFPPLSLDDMYGDPLTAAIENAKKLDVATRSLGDAAEETFSVMEQVAVQSVNNIGMAITAMVFEGQTALETLGSMVKSVFSSLVSYGVRLGAASLFPSLAPALGLPHASGGSVTGGTMYPVGERGPELLYMPPGTSGNIIPNNQLGQIGGKTIHVHMGNINVESKGGLDDKIIRRKIASVLHDEMQKVKGHYFDPSEEVA